MAGFTLFAPTLWKPATRPRRAASGGAMLPGKRDRIEMLFPRYLFVRFNRRTDDWSPIRYLPGVDSFIGPRSDQPAPMPDLAIQRIRDLCDPNGCIYPPKHAPGFPVGTSARVLDGPLSDLSGLCTWSDARRVRLLLDILGRPVTVTVAREAVEAA